MPADSGPRRGRRFLLRGLLVLLLGGLLGWKSLTLTGSRGWPGVIAFGNAGPQMVLRSAMREFGSKGILPEEDLERVRQLLPSAPLAAEPFALVGAREAQAGRVQEAERLLLEARARHPRDRQTLMALNILYLSNNRVREAASTIPVLVRLQPDAEGILLPQLVILAFSPRYRETLVQVLGDKPIMEKMLDRLVQMNAPTDAVLQLARRQRNDALKPAPEWQERLLKREISSGRIDSAYALWRRFAGAEGAATVYDSNFEGRPGPAPFNWELMSNHLGNAERGRPSGLEVEYFGRASGPLASQLLVLEPGRYEFSFAAEGKAPGEGTRLVWRLTCLGQSQAIVDLPLRDVSYAPKRFQSAFNIPAGCPAQRLELFGVTAEFPTAQQARITDVAVTPVRGR